MKSYRLAAEQGDVFGRNALGNMYDAGRGVPKDDKESAKWRTLAAEQGNSQSQFNLGVMYENGKGVPQNDKTAVKWYRLAAEQGHADAQYNLGFMYDDGKVSYRTMPMPICGITLPHHLGTRKRSNRETTLRKR